MATVLDFWREFLALTAQMAPYLLLGFGVAGLLHVFIPETWVYRQLGRRSVWTVVKGAFLGAPLPLCSCGVLPVAATLKKSGASPPAVLSFLVATPVTGIDSILATYALLGGFLAIVRPIASIAIALTAGMVMLVVTRRDPQAEEPLGLVDNSHTGGLLRRLLKAVDYAFNELLAGISRSVLLGLLIGAAISLFVPTDLVTRFTGMSLLTYVGMVLVGTPLYICATGSIPIAAALLAKGLSPGAALAFLLAGPATNAVAIAVARDLVGKRGVLVYLGTIVVGTILLGWGTDQLALWVGASSGVAPSHHHHVESVGLLVSLSGYLLLALLVYHLLAPVGRRALAAWRRGKGTPEVTLAIPGMTCQNCARKVSTALLELDSVTHVDVDVGAKTVRIGVTGAGVGQLGILQQRLLVAGYDSTSAATNDQGEGQ
jgi:uncharacterized membrane protein YraQ (UPF0718 family)/copper chaperone CopZ